MRERLDGYASMAVAAIAWGSLPVVVVAADAPAPVLVAMRMGFGAAALGCFLVVFRRRGLVPHAQRWLVALLGGVLALHWVLFFAALQLIGAAAVLIGYVFPVIVAVAAPLVLHEPRERHVLPLVAVALGGLAVMMAPEIEGGRPTGVMLALAAAVLGAGLILGARRVVQAVPGPVIAFWQYLIGAVLLVPWAAGSLDHRGVPWAWGAFIGVVLTAATGVLFYRAIARVLAQEVGVLMYLEPLAAVLFVWAVRGEAPAVTDVGGGALVLGAGVALVVMSTRAARIVTTEPVVS